MWMDLEVIMLGGINQREIPHEYEGSKKQISGKEPPANAGQVLQTMGQEHPLEKEMATHSSILTWGIPWTEEPARLQPIGFQGVRHE